MSKRVNWFITDQNVTVNYQGQTHIVKRSDPLAADLIRAIKENRMDDVPNLVSVAQAMEVKSKGKVVVRDGELLVRGVKVPAELAKKIQKFIDEGLPYQPLVKFAENLQGNPSFRAVNELFQFLEKNDHPFTENGNFIAYKKVRDDFKDVHSGTFDNSPGTVVEVPRNQVDEDSSRTCSHGLHVANYSYALSFYAGGKMLEVEVNPADVVSIPTDYNQSKIRVCKYKVLGVVETEHQGGSLRMVDPTTKFDDDEQVSDCCGCNGECGDDCGCDCDCHGSDLSEETCLECGEYCEFGYDLCVECELEQEEVDENGNDRYPFEDEFEDE
jgi:hypothetical protein